MRQPSNVLWGGSSLERTVITAEGRIFAGGVTAEGALRRTLALLGNPSGGVRSSELAEVLRREGVFWLEAVGRPSVGIGRTA